MHERHARRQDDGTLYGTAHSIASTPELAGSEREHFRPQVLAGTEFDELVVGDAIRIEQLDASLWFVDIGGLSMDVTIDRDGRPRKVFVREPEPVEGCRVEFEGEQD